MILQVKTGDVLDEPCNVLICSANPQLNMSGGVNGAILLRGGQSVQNELWAFLHGTGKPHVEPGSVVRTGPGPLPVKHILHTVAVDAFYGSSIDLVRRTLETALKLAQDLGAATVAMPSLATGYGPLSMEQFAQALSAAVQQDWPGIEQLTVVVRSGENGEIVRRVLDSLRPWNWRTVAERHDE
jgi:O-acetyl-ADP-ribose deacetylase (regulator of RNase III)